MRHLVKGKKLGRTSAHRKATFQALSVALIRERRIQTTLAKAKELRRFVEPLITRAKVDSTHNRRLVFAKLQDKEAVHELFEEVGPKAKDRPGGYTRVLKLGSRPGDSTDIAVIELVDYNDVKPESDKSERKRTRRAGSSKKTTTAKPEAKESAEEEIQETEQAEEAREQVMEEAEGTAEVSDSAEEPVSEESSEADESVDSTDFTVKEVKEKIADMDVEEAREFIGDDERVTVQKALGKKEADSDEESTDEKDK